MIQSAILRINRTYLILLAFFTFFGGNVYSQVEKKSLSLTVQHFRLIKEYSYLDIVAKSKAKKGFEPCANLKFIINKIDTTGVVADIKLGEIKTNKDGKAKFVLPPKYGSQSGSYNVKLVNDKNYEDTDETVSAAYVTIQASVEKTDSLYVLKARLLDSSNKPIADETLKSGLKRLFGLLSLDGEDSYTTDADGTITVPFDNKGLTGINGKLNFQVIIDESDKYGTVVANVYKSFGVPIIDKSSFNERTMWAPPTKTPYFLLIIPNMILIGIWSILTLLLINLYKIFKSKN